MERTAKIPDVNEYLFDIRHSEIPKVKLPKVHEHNFDISRNERISPIPKISATGVQDRKINIRTSLNSEMPTVVIPDAMFSDIDISQFGILGQPGSEVIASSIFDNIIKTDNIPRFDREIQSVTYDKNDFPEQIKVPLAVSAERVDEILNIIKSKK